MKKYKTMKIQEINAKFLCSLQDELEVEKLWLIFIEVWPSGSKFR